MDFITKKILILVKTYPSISKKYVELVCTAGMDEDGNWYRLYPIPFRKLDDDKQYGKYRWIEARMYKGNDDPRIESYKVDYERIKLLEQIKSNDWGRKSNIVLKKAIYDDLSKLIKQSNTTNMSLAVFKPKKIIDFIWEEDSREYPKERLAAIEAERKQLSLFSNKDEDVDVFKIVDKLPYKFSYIFEDINGKRSTLMIEDWEVGAAFWNWKKHYGSEEMALQKIKEKFFEDYAKKKDLYFFLGTTRQFHGRAKNPFIIIGLFPLPNVIQNSLF